MSSYRHTQPGLVVIGSLAAAAILIVALARSAGWHPVLLGVLAVFAVALALFSSLTVEIRGGELVVAFGIGFPRFTYELSRIRAARVVRNPWYYGWGIHMTPDGWLYNVSGFFAIEIVLVEGRKVRIGTDEPDGLYRALAPYVPHERR
jgi:hypothetical protein